MYHSLAFLFMIMAHLLCHEKYILALGNSLQDEDEFFRTEPAVETVTPIPVIPLSADLEKDSSVIYPSDAPSSKKRKFVYKDITGGYYFLLQFVD